MVWSPINWRGVTDNWANAHTLLINPINPTGYHLIIILLLIYYMCRFSEICNVYIYLTVIFWGKAHRICLIVGI